MKKFFVTLFAMLALTLTAAVAEQRDTTQTWALTVSSRETINDTDGSVLGYRMAAQSGQHTMYIACLAKYKDCWPLNPNTGEFSFHYINNSDSDAYKLEGTQALGSMAVTTGDGTRVVLFYWDR